VSHLRRIDTSTGLLSQLSTFKCRASRSPTHWEDNVEPEAGTAGDPQLVRAITRCPRLLQTEQINMFGFGRKPDHSGELLEFLVDAWEMKPRVAGAFIAAYGKGASTRLDEGTKRAEAQFAALSEAERLQLFAAGDEPRKFAVIAEAYNAFLTDIRKGKHAGTDVELAVWAILWNDSALLEQIDAGLANFIVESQPTKYPDIDLLAFS